MHLLVNTINLNLKRLTKPSSLVLLFNVNSRRPLYLSSSLFNNETTTPPPSVSEDPAGNSVFLKKKYSDTLLLPKTDFPMKVAHAKREEHENTIANKRQFEQLYGFQSLWRQGQPEFVLHDGPPYANGDVHIGHAVNKILKDITNRYKLLRGYQINYIPGWDCHGLPIELKATKDGKRGILTDPLSIQTAARKIVDESIAKHIEAFKRWGILAEWNSPYKTFDKSYIKAELQAFLQLYDKKLVFRDLKPVYWSPSSKTALAEAELEYNQKHESPSVFLSLDLESTNIQEFISKIDATTPTVLDKDAQVQVLIWTTTPWTLPSNRAIAFNKTEKYCLLDARQSNNKVFYVVASALRTQFCVAKNANYATVLEFSGEHLSKLTYKHPWFENEICPFVHSDHVTMEKGTGLVHVAPAHGHDDFVLGLQHNLAMDCYVDDQGEFDSTIPKLKALPVLSLGNKVIMKELANKIVCSTTIIHSYPYDWRTKLPVIIKTSKQWFVHTEDLKSKALDLLKNVHIHPKNVENGMLSQLIRRPFWCISRQRTWGVPIPVLYNKETGEPLINKKIVDRLCELVDKSSNIDYWWTCPVSEIIPDDMDPDDFTKGKDIFDIWYDSGLSWHLLGGKIADMYLEGKDQFQGWFQSSLLLSTALRETSPYKNLYVHGFVVDEHGKKMSKSIGNVVSPWSVVTGCAERNQPAYGADVLRWWVAAQGSADGGNISASSALLRSADESVQKLRNVIKFLISYCNEAAAADLNLDNISYDELMYTDQYMLALLRDFRNQVTTHYEDYNYHRVLMKTLHFATSEVSSQYFTWAKDRLYCDFLQSQSRKSCIYVLSQIYSTLSKILAPVLPYLVEESYSHYKLGNQSIFKSTWFAEEPSWDNKNITTTFDLVLDIRESLNHIIGANNPKDLWVELQCDAKNFQTLQILHPLPDDDIDKCDSELCDILQISGLDLKCYEVGESNPKTDPLQPINFAIKPTGVGHSHTGYSVGICKTKMMQCARCRRFCCTPGDVLCTRCLSVMKSILQKQSQATSPAQVESSKKKVVNI